MADGDAHIAATIALAGAMVKLSGVAEAHLRSDEDAHAASVVSDAVMLAAIVALHRDLLARMPPIVEESPEERALKASVYVRLKRLIDAPPAWLVVVLVSVIWWGLGNVGVHLPTLSSMLSPVHEEAPHGGTDPAP